jgi:hypothetical protein
MLGGMMKITLAQPFCHTAHTAWRKVRAEAVILDVDTAVYYSMKGVGLRIWELLGEKKSAEQILPILVSEFDAPSAEIEKDLLQVVGKLAKERLIEVA